MSSTGTLQIVVQCSKSGGSFNMLGAWSSIPFFGGVFSIGFYNEASYYSAIVFDDIPLSKGVTIENIELWFTPNSLATVPSFPISDHTQMIAAFSNTDNPTPPTSNATALSLIDSGLTPISRGYFAAGEWNDALAAASQYLAMIDLKVGFQTLVDRVGWVENSNRVVLFFCGDSSAFGQQTELYESISDVYLRITYTDLGAAGYTDNITVGDAVSVEHISQYRDIIDNTILSDSVDLTTARLVDVPGIIYGSSSQIKNYDYLAVFTEYSDRDEQISSNSLSFVAATDGMGIYLRFSNVQMRQGRNIDLASIEFESAGTCTGATVIDAVNADNVNREYEDSSSYDRQIVTSAGNSPGITSDAKFGGALNLNGLEDGYSITIPDALTTGLDGQYWVIDFWLKPDGCKGTIYDGGCRLSYNGDNNRELDIIFGSIPTSAVTATTSGANLADGVWVHIAIVRDNNTAYVYINGIVKATLDVTDASIVFDSDDELRLGSFWLESYICGLYGGEPVYCSRTVYFHGIIDEFRISNVTRISAGNPFAVPTSAYNTDEYTTCLLHFDGSSGSGVAVFTTVNRMESLTYTNAVASQSSGADTYETFLTADISSILQEIVNRDGWENGNDILIRIKITSGVWSVFLSSSFPILYIKYLDSPGPRAYLGDSVYIENSLDITIVNQALLSNEYDANSILDLIVDDCDIVMGDDILFGVGALYKSMPDQVVEVADVLSISTDNQIGTIEEDILMSDIIDADWHSNSIFVNITATAGLYK